MKMVTVPTAVKQLQQEGKKVSESTLRRKAQRGELPHMMLGNRILVDVDIARAALTTSEGVGIEEVSRQTGLSVSAIRRGVRDGWLPARMEGKAYRFDLEAVHDAIMAQMQG